MGLAPAVFGMVPVVHAQDAGSTVSPDSGSGDALSSIGDVFGVKNTIALKNTMNYGQCFDSSYSLTWGWSAKCKGTMYGGPYVVIHWKYTEPSVLAEVVSQPGESALAKDSSMGSIKSGEGDGASILGSLMGGKSMSGRSAPWEASQYSNMPTAGFQPSQYYEVHMWGVGPLGRFETLNGDDKDYTKATLQQVTRSMACDVGENIDYWEAPFVPDLELQLLGSSPEMFALVLYNWGMDWYGGASQAMGGLASMGSGGGGGMGGGGIGGVFKAAGTSPLAGLVKANTNAVSADGGGGGGGAVLAGGGAGAGGTQGGTVAQGDDNSNGIVGASGNAALATLSAITGGGAGAAQTAAGIVGNFTQSIGSTAARVAAGAASLAAYALNSTDANYVCGAKQTLDASVSAADQAVSQVNQVANLKSLMPAASYLPAGYAQQNIGYDSCPMTGTGFIMGTDDQIAFSNCTPQPTYVRINCTRQSAKVVDTKDMLLHGGMGAIPLPKLVNPCLNPVGATQEGPDIIIYRKVPQCTNRLSTYQQGNYYLACNRNSVTYRHCGALLQGTQGMTMSENGREYKGPYTFCALPLGTKTVDQLTPFNNLIYTSMTQSTRFASQALHLVADKVSARARAMGTACTTDQGGLSTTTILNTTASGASIYSTVDDLSATTSSAANSAGGTISGGSAPAVVVHTDVSAPLVQSSLKSLGMSSLVMGIGGGSAAGGTGGTGMMGDIGTSIASNPGFSALGDLGSALGGAAGAVGGQIGDMTAMVGSTFNSLVGSISSGPLGQVGSSIASAFGGFTSGISGAMGSLTGGLTGSLGNMTGAMGLGSLGNMGIGDLAGSLGMGSLGSSLSGAMGGLGGAMGGAMGGLSGAMGGAMGGISSMGLGSLGSSTGLGSLGSMSSPLGSMTGMMGGLSSMTSMAGSLGNIGNMVGGVIGSFSGAKLIPLYISESDENAWRHGSVSDMLGSSVSGMTSQVAGGALSYGQAIMGETTGAVGDWGPEKPCMGFVPTSGDNFPASGLAAYRGYQCHAAAMISSEMKDTGFPLFNLDYPHHTGCTNMMSSNYAPRVGTSDDAWESRDKKATSGGGFLGSVASIFGFDTSGGIGGALGSILGGFTDTRIEDGKFVYTYWKHTACKIKACAVDGKVLSHSRENGQPGGSSSALGGGLGGMMNNVTGGLTGKISNIGGTLGSLGGGSGGTGGSGGDGGGTP